MIEIPEGNVSIGRQESQAKLFYKQVIEIPKGNVGIGNLLLLKIKILDYNGSPICLEVNTI